MKKVLASLILTLVVTTFFSDCINTDEPAQPSNQCVGLWKTRLPFKPLIHYDVLLDFDIKPGTDSLFTITGISDSTKDTILMNRGFWKLSSLEDTIILSGTHCRIIDTSLNQLVTRDCGNPMNIYIDIEDKEWTIKVSDLLPIAEQMHIIIPPSFVPKLKTTLLVLEKQ